MMCHTDKKHFINGILTVIGAFLIQFAFGYFYTVSNMIPYILSYIKLRVDPNVNDGLVVWLSGLGYGVQGLTMPLGGFLAKKVDYRIIVAIGCIIHSGSVFLTNLSVQEGFYAVIITYAVLICGGLGLAYSVVMEVSGAYFPKKYGMIIGIVVGGYGLSALVFSPLQTTYINPSNKPVNINTGLFDDPQVLDRIPIAFLIFGGVLLSLELIGCLLLRPRPKPKVEEDAQELQKAYEDDDDAAKLQDTENLTPSQLFCTVDFYLLFVVLVLLIIPISVVVSNYKYFGGNNVSDDQFLTIIASITALFNCGGRIVWGFVLDKLSFKVPLVIILSWFAVLLLIFPHFEGLPETAFKALYTLWVIQLFFCLSGTFTVMPTAMKILFGPKNLSVNYGILFNACFVGSIIIGGVLSVVKVQDVFIELFSSCGCICIVALCVVVWIKDKKIPRKLNICRWCSTRCGREDEAEYR